MEEHQDDKIAAGKTLIYALIGIGAALIGKKFKGGQDILTCPICLEHPLEVVLLSNCGHIIGRECLIPYFKERKCCPLCKTGPTEDEYVNEFQMQGVFDPVSLEPMKNAARLIHCGHTLDRERLIPWIEKKGVCPECGAPATVNDIEKNYQVQAVIDQIAQ